MPPSPINGTSTGATRSDDGMLRVAFLLPADSQGWIGGSNYLSNLLRAVATLPDRRIETLLFAHSDADDDDLSARFPADRIVRTPLVLQRHPLRLFGKLTERAIGYNLPFERLLRRERVDLVSHALPAGDRPRTPTLSWIADFQELHIPDFFSNEELVQRRRGHDHVAQAARMIVLSSEDAQRDLATILPDAVTKSRILRFTSGLNGQDRGRRADELRAAYQLNGPFFHLPNQFWIHKNHRCVIDALAILRRQGLDATVVCTGHTGDYRHPDFFTSLQAHAEHAGVSDLFRVEGLVPYPDVTAFMRDSVAVINPSLFEGWSTTVEEAKAQGKTIILSDIGVHREQAPARGIYFSARDPEALAARMREALSDYSPDRDRISRDEATAALPGRMRAFAETYQAIVMDACGRTSA